jgi:hypothetical protein
MLIVCFRQFFSTREIQSAQARNGRKIVVWPDFDSSTLERLVGIRLANYTVGGVAGFSAVSFGSPKQRASVRRAG